ncbi:hypothetical protein HJC23_005075 [Cyclotella cryptica]|uniref:Uncharacterized protein n=1 Tax=Cyclotella cryptica TaxID=29204 RepID=A0ABD3QED0_9STRA
MNAKASEWKQGRRAIATSNANSTFKLIGGPEEVGSSQWQTEAQSACQSKTAIDQLTKTGRSMHIRGKKSTIPSYENVRPFNETAASRLRGENPYSLNEGSMKTWNDASQENANGVNSNRNSNLIGYRAPRGGESFLVGLGRELAADNND